MSSQVSSLASSTEVTRRRLTVRQAETVQNLVAAAEDEVREQGYDGLTVRNVARRAGVAPATAYTYFASKDHLVAEVFWRRLRDLPEPHVDRRRSAASRLSAALADLALLVADEPELSSAVSIAMLGRDPDVAALREHIGAAMTGRIVAALGDQADAAVVSSVDLLLTGALLRAGMGYIPYTDLPDLLAGAVDIVLGGR